MKIIFELANSQLCQGLAGTSAGLAALMALKTTPKNILITSSILNVVLIGGRVLKRESLVRSDESDADFSMKIHGIFQPANIIGATVAVGTVAYSIFSKQMPKLWQSAAYGCGIGALVNLMGDLVNYYLDRNRAL